MSDERGMLMWALQRPDGSLIDVSFDDSRHDYPPQHMESWAELQGYRAVRVRVTVEDGDE